MDKEQVKEITTEVFTRLDVIAEKMGTTIDYLWPAFMRAEIAHGITQFVVSILLFTVGVLIIRKLVQLITRHKKDEELVGACMFGILVTTAIFAGISIDLFGSGIESIIAPEVGALNRLMTTLK